MEGTKFMEAAILLSKKAIDDYNGGPFGCVIVKDGKIIGEGWNQVVTLNDATAHAEIMAIRDACANLGTPELVGCQLYTSCEPCPMCLAAAYWACIDTLYYANTVDDNAALGYEDHIVYEEMKKDPAKRKIKMIHMPLPAAMQVFNDWRLKNG